MSLEETIFEQALGLSSSQARAEYLRSACAGDPVMLDRLEGLLRAHDRAGNFLEHDPAEESAPAVAVHAAASIIGEAAGPALTEKAGEHIGRYKLLEKIGEGGFGEVWMAEQKEPVKRLVALKIIKLDMDTKAVIARFEAERQALAMMDRPNIAKVLDAGATDGGRPYFVMELVRGVNLTKYCNKNELSNPERLKLLIQVCRAIQHAHQKGVIHRDIKPLNILVTLHDGVPVPKVIDFGIAKATQQELTEKTVFTQFRQFLGTPAYISPEQAEMSGLEVDTRSDIYSLGVLLYELLTGKTPFDTQELLKAGLEGMRQIICEREPLPPSTRLNRELAAGQAGLPGQSKIENRKSKIENDLDWIVMKCLEKDRTRRYETANGLATADAPGASHAARASGWNLGCGLLSRREADCHRQQRPTAKVWETLTGRLLRTIAGHSEPVFAAAFSPDDRFIATASGETVSLLDTASGDERVLPTGHRALIKCLAFAPNGRRIVTSGNNDDQTARIWQAASAEELAQWQEEEKQAAERLEFAARRQADAAQHERTLRVRDPGVIQEWLVLPLTMFTNQTGAAALTQEQVPGEALLRPRAGKWRAIRVYDAFINLDTINRVNAKRSVAYAATYIRSDAEQTNFTLKVGSDDEARIYLNGDEIYRRAEPRTYVQDQDDVMGVVLRTGLNVLVLKVVMDLDENTDRDWRCSLRFADAAGQPVKGIRTTITPADAQDPGAISQWLVLAPIHFEGTNGTRALEEKQRPDEAHLHPRAGARCRAGRDEVFWQESRLEDYALDSKAVAGTTNTDYAVAYAVCYIQNETNQPGLIMTVGSDDQAKVYLNGKEIYRYDQPRAFLPDQDEVPGVELKAGINTLVFKVVNERVDWAGSVRFTDAAGQPVKGIRVTLTPP